MSITDEMREWFINKRWFGWGFEHTIEEMLDRIDAAVDGMVELPKDADGVPVRVGDKVYQVEGGWVYTVKSITFYPENTTVSFECKHGFGCDSAHNVRHYHAPTVEDVLTEFAERWHDAKRGERTFDYNALVAEYAKRLTLAVEEDA